MSQKYIITWRMSLKREMDNGPIKVQTWVWSENCGWKMDWTSVALYTRVTTFIHLYGFAIDML